MKTLVYVVFVLPPDLSLDFTFTKENGRSSHADVVLTCVFMCAKFSTKKKDLRK